MFLFTRKHWFLATITFAGLTVRGLSTPEVFNFEEERVNMAPLPDPLLMPDGRRVSNSETWTSERRPALLEIFKKHVYGKFPSAPPVMRSRIVAEDREALGGLAVRREVILTFSKDDKGPDVRLLMFIPKNAGRPVPAFLGLNFWGNHCVSFDPAVPVTTKWVREDKTLGIEGNRITEATRGMQAGRWEVERVVKRGYATVTAYYGDLEPDHPDGWRSGIRGFFSPAGEATQWQEDDWGAIGAWAWGLCRALDYLQGDADVDAARVAVHGHSRLGKAALWAGVNDTRFAMVISNNSGEGGAALARRDFGETIARITSRFPHWFSNKFATYSGRAHELPVDQHELLALIAPRPLYVASATLDRWSDPRGEFLSAKYAGPVYSLFGKNGVGVEEQPEPDSAVGDQIRYHIRTGEHDITAFDWDRYLDFAEQHLKVSK